MSHAPKLRLAIAALLGGGMLLPGACVWRTEHKIETNSKIEAHIVLDIRQIKEEGAAVEDYVRGDSATPPKAEGSKPSSALTPREERGWLAGLALESRAVAAGDTPAPPVAPAAPAEAEKPVTSAAEKAAIERRKARAEQILTALKAHKLGEGDRGYVVVLTKEAGGSGDADERKALDTLAKSENADRKVIYQAIAGRNKSPLDAVEPVLAETIREKMKAGQMFRAPKLDAEFAKFKESELGKKYPDAKAGDWLEKK